MDEEDRTEAGNCESFGVFLEWYNEKFTAQAYVDGYASKYRGKFGKLCGFSKIVAIFIRTIHKISIKIFFKCIRRVPSVISKEQGHMARNWGRNLPIAKQNTVAHLTGTRCYSLSSKVVTILDCMTGCLRKRLVKEQITICTDRQVALGALVASETKSLLVADGV